MTIDVLKKWVRTGRELEFSYKGKDYSITYFRKNRKIYISFCEFYKETLDVATVDELWNSTNYPICYLQSLKMTSMFTKD